MPKTGKYHHSFSLVRGGATSAWLLSRSSCLNAKKCSRFTGSLLRLLSEDLVRWTTILLLFGKNFRGERNGNGEHQWPISSVCSSFSISAMNSLSSIDSPTVSSSFVRSKIFYAKPSSDSKVLNHLASFKVSETLSLFGQGGKTVARPSVKRLVLQEFTLSGEWFLPMDISPMIAHPNVSLWAKGEFGGPKTCSKTWCASIASRPTRGSISASQSSGLSSIITLRRWGWCLMISGVGLSFRLLGMSWHSMTSY